VWDVRTVMSAIRSFVPELAGIMDRLATSFHGEGEQAALRELFPSCPKVSIDYAVMEKYPDIHVIASDLGWSDLGTWGSVREHLEVDADGNAKVGTDIRLHGCKGTVVHATDARTVIVQGLEGYIVAEKDGRILVCSLADEQSIKEYSQERN